MRHLSQLESWSWRQLSKYMYCKYRKPRITVPTEWCSKASIRWGWRCLFRHLEDWHGHPAKGSSSIKKTHGKPASMDPSCIANVSEDFSILVYRYCVKVKSAGAPAETVVSSVYAWMIRHYPWSLERKKISFQNQGMRDSQTSTNTKYLEPLQLHQHLIHIYSRH